MLRDYQTALNEEVGGYFDDGVRSVLAVLPTGAGKTMTAAFLAKRYPKVLWVAHRRELLQQASLTLTGHPGARTHSVFAEPPVGEYDLLVLDEAHHAPAATVRRFLAGCSHKRLLGLTATPKRLDREYLGFNAIIYGTTYDDLVHRGYLTPIDLYTVRIRKDSLLIDWMYANPKIMRKAIVFTRTRAEARFLRTALSLAYKTEVVLGDSDRETILKRYQEGDLNILVSCEVLTEGTDLPCTESIILDRGTTSKSLLKQMIGRGVRTAPNKTHCNVVQGVKMRGKKNHLLVSSVVTPRNHYISSNPLDEWNTVKLVSEKKDFEVTV